jgi:hypothetical protein
MRLAPAVLAVLATLVVGSAGCDRRQEAPPPPPAPVEPVSLWTAEDAKAIAEQLVAAALRDPWTAQFRDRTGRPVGIAIGEIADRSGQRVDVAALSAELAAAVQAAAGDRIVAASGEAKPDAVVGGVIGSSSGSLADGTPAIYFAIDLVFADPATGERLGIFAVERPVAQR